MSVSASVQVLYRHSSNRFPPQNSVQTLDCVVITRPMLIPSWRTHNQDIHVVINIGVLRMSFNKNAAWILLLGC